MLSALEPLNPIGDDQFIRVTRQFPSFSSKNLSNYKSPKRTTRTESRKRSERFLRKEILNKFLPSKFVFYLSRGSFRNFTTTQRTGSRYCISPQIVSSKFYQCKVVLDRSLLRFTLYIFNNIKNKDTFSSETVGPLFLDIISVLIFYRDDWE